MRDGYVDATPEVCVDVVKARGLQADPGFIMKIVSLLDILGVRHCCFIIGQGCTQLVWSVSQGVHDLGLGQQFW